VVDPFLFGLAAFIVLATPGPTNTLLLTAGVTVGLRRSAPLLLAEVGGYGISIGAFLVAGGLISSAVPAARAALRGVVALYLLGLAITLWRRKAEVGTCVVLWRHVFVTTLLNPKALVLAFVIIPRHFPNAVTYFAALIAIIPFVGASWIILGALPRSRIRWLSAVAPKIGAVVVASFALLFMISSIEPR